MSATTAQPSSIHPAEMPMVRAAAGGACGILLSFAGLQVAQTSAAWVVARRGGLVDRPARWLSPATWGIAAYLALNTVGNAASTSSVERYAFGSATALASVLTALVAYRARNHRSVGVPT